MSRAAVVYLGMILTFVAGLWAVLAVGGGLVAPEALDGRWTAAGDGTGGSAGPWQGLTVEQSGRYLELAFDQGPSFGVTASPPAADGRLTLARGPWHVTIDPPARSDGTRTFHVDGPATGTFTGRRGAARPPAAASKGARRPTTAP